MSVSQTTLGKVLDAVSESDSEELYRCYLDDFVHYVYHKRKDLECKVNNKCSITRILLPCYSCNIITWNIATYLTRDIAALV